MTHLPSRAAIVATARGSIGRGSQSFAAASRLFDAKTRERAWLLYAWCRRCDDLADGQDHGRRGAVAGDAAARLAMICERTQAALDGDWVGDPAFDALRIVVAEAGVPHRLIWDLVEGFALDTAAWRPADEAELLRYCYHVAGAVGCMMAVVMGVSPTDGDTLDRASDLGIALQLANIARDLADDAADGRCYVPATWQAEGLTRADIAQRLAERARAYEASAAVGAARLDFRSAWAVLAATGIYGAILRKVVARGDRAWDRRVSTSAAEKLSWIARAFWQALRRHDTGISRQGLWTRPT